MMALYDERDEALLRAERAELILEMVAVLHHPDGFGSCQGCGLSHPCKTTRLLDDEVRNHV